MPTNPDFATTTLRVTRWHDSIFDARGHEPRSGYVERFWLPVIGPTAVHFRSADNEKFHC